VRTSDREKGESENARGGGERERVQGFIFCQFLPDLSISLEGLQL